ncbi:hypothetical protein [Hoyosella subflava]|uniref:MinD-like ATPase involved in chromosome partitioning or flagellar assembly n=1 Tax=Hoyosella subflava (strain DSM 45089 / JCM 17490 / NBRC 109087 / DQS3-9A1) TaxID=443218 RepID=F6ESH8_HOYSD|nr:hypothetical protein [Hoyosella subflava]AEF43099.1 hypothetical protein AS9A_P20055 [Hoyosella subflava DQS3-9A1]
MPEKSRIVTLMRSPEISNPAALSAVIVAGSGGAASTTTAFGLSTALRLGTGCEVSVVDTTSDGGNLLARTAAGTVAQSQRLRQFEDTMAVTSAGAVVFGAGEEGSLGDPALIDELLAARGSARVYDAGSAFRSPRLTRLIDSGPPLVVTAPARAEPLARLRAALKWLAATYGQDFLSETVVVLSHQAPKPMVDVSGVREALESRTAGVVEIPFDPVLARPGVLDHTRISRATFEAWTDVLDIIGRFAPVSEEKENLA